jgi:RNA polymerase sigma-70 factor (ECF subfamily)
MDQGDEELLSLLATDLDHHFRSLVETYQQRLYLFARRLTGHTADAEDIVQEVFLRAYHALRGFPADKIRLMRLRQWLYAITLNIFRNRKRRPEHPSVPLDLSKENLLLELAVQSLGPEEEVQRQEWRRELEMYVAVLPESYRVVVTLYYFEDLSYAEMAELLNQPIGTVKGHLSRARRLLQKLLVNQEYGGTERDGIQRP